MANYDTKIEQDPFRALAGIILFGVPSQGMAIGSLVSMVGDGPNRELLESLGPNSYGLRYMSRTFLRILDSQDSFYIVNFFETRLSPTAVRDVRVYGSYR